MTLSSIPPPTTFAVQADESLTGGLKRITIEQINLAIWQFVGPCENTDIAIHEARKALKKARAMLRLLRGCLGHATYGAANIALRDAGRGLSEFRISTVLEETMADVIAHSSQAFPADAFPALRKHLHDHHERLLQEFVVDKDLMGQEIELMSQGRELVTQMPCTDEGFAAIRCGLQRTYRRGRKELAACQQHPTPIHFHLWRKRVKYLRHQMSVLNLLWPALMQAYTAELVTLSNYLGVQHDLIDLRTYLASLEEPALQAEIAVLMPALDAYRQELEAAALHLGAFIYAERPAAFRRRLEQYWRLEQKKDT
ncbi:MAG: CHAD domain-containing protein [Chloroflexi bacterium]|nr:CHAD domain-containing protein [Chloroflexota bacterium]